MGGTRVAIDGRPLYDAGKFRGMGVYLRGLLEPLASRQGIHVSALVTEGVTLPAGVDPVIVCRSAPGRVAHLEHMARLSWDLLHTPHDVFHSPHLDPPLWSRRPSVLTLYDLIPLVVDHPEFRGLRARWRMRARQIRNASAVIAISRHTADEAIREFALDRARVHVVHLGVSPAFEPLVKRPEANPPYVLYVGEFGPSKGYPEAFEVIGRLAAAGFPHELRVVGRIADWVRADVEALVANSPRPDRIRLLGWVPEKELISLYQSASALIVTSRYEGFGLPALEAMATGTPVAAFSNSSIPEVVGDGGILVPDGDVGEMADRVQDLFRHTAMWSEFSERGIARSKRFDWETCADRHAEVYENVARRSRKG